MRCAICIAASAIGRLGSAAVVWPNRTSQRSNKAALRLGMATCVGMGMPAKRRVPSSTADQKSDSRVRCSSQSWTMPLNTGPRSASDRTLP